ncbi:hypothetical protein O3P69_010885 [Scylla paramamosain]|uniref:Secreted protein n=1 Tax=Scylla paramamosain TaxID=85552 RepID=A0AAW0TJD8_SCYPA
MLRGSSLVYFTTLYCFVSVQKRLSGDSLPDPKPVMNRTFGSYADRTRGTRVKFQQYSACLKVNMKREGVREGVGKVPQVC